MASQAWNNMLLDRDGLLADDVEVLIVELILAGSL